MTYLAVLHPKVVQSAQLHLVDCYFIFRFLKGEIPNFMIEYSVHIDIARK